MKGESLRNLSGVIHYQSTPVIRFAYRDNNLVEFKYLVRDKSLMPFEVRSRRSKLALTDFLLDRPLPRTRHNIKYCLELLGLEEYDKELIIRATHGLCTDDSYWIKFPEDEEKLCYEDIRIK